MLKHLNPSGILKTKSWLFAVPVTLIIAAHAAFAQDEKFARITEPGPTITASATAERVRVAAPNTVVQLRLEIYDDAGRKLFDTEQRGAPADWRRIIAN